VEKRKGCWSSGAKTSGEKCSDLARAGGRLQPYRANVSRLAAIAEDRRARSFGPRAIFEGGCGSEPRVPILQQAAATAAAGGVRLLTWTMRSSARRSRHLLDEGEFSRSVFGTGP